MEENIRQCIFPNEIDGILDLNQVSYLDKARYQLIGGRGLSKESLVPTDFSPDVSFFFIFWQ
jgi:hypothetical protein